MQVLLGIDGGGHKTLGVIVTPAGRVLARERGPASAIVGEPRAESRAVLSAIVDSLCAQAGVSRAQVQICGVGLNGIDFEDEHPMQHREIAAALDLPQDRVVLVNDGLVALWGASGAPAATLLQHGSGFTGAYRPQYGREELFDHLHVADTYDMRRGLLSLVARMLNGMADPTPLKDKALAHFGIADESKYCEAVYRHRIPQELRQTTPPLIYSSWLEGDPAAAALVETAADDYALAAKAMIAAAGSASPEVTFGGGVIIRGPRAFWELLAQRVRDYCPGATVKPPDLSPEFGAAIMAGYHAGVDPQKLHRKICESRPGAEA